MRRILVIGSCGAGKSYFARRLGHALGVEVVHLDALFWRAGWVQTPRDEWRRVVEELLPGESWVMDGNYASTLDLRLAACDTAVFLDTPKLTCLWRVLKRRVLYRDRRRPDMAAGCPEKLDWQLLKWVCIYPREEILQALSRHARGKRVYVLRSEAEVENFLRGL